MSNGLVGPLCKRAGDTSQTVQPEAQKRAESVKRVRSKFPRRVDACRRSSVALQSNALPRNSFDLPPVNF